VVTIVSEPPAHPEVRSASPATAGALVGQVAAGAAAGLPLDEVLFAVAEDAGDRKLARAAAELGEALRRGVDLRQALAAMGGRLPGYLQRSLEASASVGQMAAVLTGIAEHEATRKRLRRQVRTALLYPLIVLGLLVALLMGLTTWLVPMFESIYQDFDLVLPDVTVFLIALSHAIPKLWIGLGALVAACLALSFSARGKRLLHWVRSGVPVLGRLWIWSAQHEFASILGALATQRVATDEALRCTAASLRDHNLARATRIAARKCASGVPLAQSLADSIHFDPALPALISWGEQHGALGAALKQAAQTFEEELEMQSAFLQRIMPSVLFITVTTTMFFFVVGLFVPLVDLINNLSG
jgi:type II secretory pathway component PulF